MGSIGHVGCSYAGFLVSGDGQIDGNFGIKDQVFALKWVNENIHNFRGDANKVVVTSGAVMNAWGIRQYDGNALDILYHSTQINVTDMPQKSELFDMIVGNVQIVI